MAKKWSEVAASPEYQKLSDSEKEAARSQYFDEVVAPKVPEDRLSDVRAAFDADTAPKAANRGSPLDHPDAGNEVVSDKRKPGPAGFWRTTPPQTDAERPIGGPWEKYAVAAKKPWERYSAARANSPEDAAAAPGDDDTQPQSKASWLDRVGAGLMDPVVGFNQLAANTLVPNTGIARSENEYAANREQKLQAEGIGSSDPLRMAGEVANPLNYIPAVKGAEEVGLGTRVVQSALTGAASTAMSPVASGDYWWEKSKQAAVGAVAGPIMEGATNALSAFFKPVSDVVVPEVVKLARSAGYVLPPQMIRKEPGAMASTLNALAGPVKTMQAASVKNQEVTNTLAKRALGLGHDADLTADVDTFHAVRAEAGKAYQAIKNKIPTVMVNSRFERAIKGLGGTGSHAAQLFPEVYKNADVSGLIGELTKHREFPTDVAMDLVKKMRFDAKINLRAPDPTKHALGLSQREAADAIDELIDDNVVAASHLDKSLGKEGQEGSLVEKYKEARRQIAKSYDVESVTNPATGDVNARGLAALQRKGRPLSGELSTIANMAAAFPKAVQNASSFGGHSPHSAIDAFAATMALGHGHPGLAATLWGRPIARATVLSDGFQDRMVRKPDPAMVNHLLPLASETRNYVANALAKLAPYSAPAGAVAARNVLVPSALGAPQGQP